MDDLPYILEIQPDPCKGHFDDQDLRNFRDGMQKLERMYDLKWQMVVYGGLRPDILCCPSVRHYYGDWDELYGKHTGTSKEPIIVHMNRMIKPMTFSLTTGVLFNRVSNVWSTNDLVEYEGSYDYEISPASNI